MSLFVVKYGGELLSIKKLSNNGASSVFINESNTGFCSCIILEVDSGEEVKKGIESKFILGLLLLLLLLLFSNVFENILLLLKSFCAGI